MTVIISVLGPWIGPEQERAVTETYPSNPCAPPVAGSVLVSRRAPTARAAIAAGSPRRYPVAIAGRNEPRSPSC